MARSFVLCERCTRRLATTHLLYERGDRVRLAHFCDRCAAHAPPADAVLVESRRHPIRTAALLAGAALAVMALARRLPR
jgi:protein-arginine kinase activator protein McsA